MANTIIEGTIFMKVLFIDSNEVLMNLLPNGFSSAGHEIMISGSIADFTHLSTMMDQFSPDLVVTYGWGQEQTHEKQYMLKTCVQARQIPHVYWSVEDPLYTDSFVVPLIMVSQPDYIFTICSSKISYFHSLGFRAGYMDWGVQPTIHYPTIPDPQYAVDIAVIANSYDWILNQYSVDQRMESITNLVIPLVANNIRVDIWGKGWQEMFAYLGITIDPSWLHGPLPFHECNKVYNSAKINIGFQNYTTQVTQRTYEVLGAGGFLLSQDTPAVRQLFEPGKHLVVSSSPQETLNNVIYYLQAEGERQTIANQGYTATLQHTYRNRVEYMLQVLRNEGILSL